MPTDEIRVIAIDIQLISAEYGFETRLAPTDKIRVLALDIQPMLNEYGSKNNLC